MEHTPEEPEATARSVLDEAVARDEAGAGFDDLLYGLGGPHLSRARLLALQRSAGNQAVLRLLREVAPGAAAQGQPSPAGRLTIVADHARAVAGEVRQGEFLDAVQHAVCDLAERELAGTIYTAKGCPWIAHWIGYYRDRTPAEVQSALVRYAPAAASASSSGDAVEAICDRVSAGITAWRDTNVIPNVSLPGHDAQGGAAKDSPGPGQTANDSPATAGRDASRALARAVDDSEHPARVQAELGPGQPLDPSLAGRMRSLIGPDIAAVRIHTDQAGGRVAQRHDAAAVAVGRHVAFAPGAYEPGTPLGEALIAHELAHVAQHTDSPGTSVASEAEAEADAVQAGVAAFVGADRAGTWPASMPQLRRRVRSGLALRRCGSDDTPVSEGVWGRAPQLIRPGFDRDGSVPGRVPMPVTNAGVFRFDFDGDGDQTPELKMDVTAAEVWQSGAVKRVTVGLTQISSDSRDAADFELPDAAQGGGPLNVAVAELTDGDRPSVIELDNPASNQVLRVQPPERFPNQVRYLVELASRPAPNSPARVTQRVNYPFAPETAAINDVFTTADPSEPADKQGPQGFQREGDIWSLDVTVGAYGDRFRMTFRRVREGITTVEMGLAVVAENYAAGSDDEKVPLAGHTVVLEVNGELAPKIMYSTGPRLVLDLDGDSFADVIVYDRLTLPTGDAEPGTRDRDHEITVTPIGRPPKRFSFEVRHGLIKAGPPQGSPIDFFSASDAHAVSSLRKQEEVGTFEGQKGQLVGELLSVERTLAGLRKQAADNGLISKEPLYKAWEKAELDFAALSAYASSEPPQDLVDSVVLTGKAFYDALAQETKGAEEIAPDDYESQSHTKTNPYTGSSTTYGTGSPNVDDVGETLAGALKAKRWNDAYAIYRGLVDGLDRWVAYVNRQKYGKDVKLDEPETQLALVGERMAGLRRELHKLEGKNPVRVSAVLHTDEYFEKSGDIQDIALSMYYWREDDTWYVIDLTTPDETPHWTTTARPEEKEPPKELFDQLDDNAHFPKGEIHWLLPSGTGGSVRTTGPSTLRRWATYIGVGAAAIGLGLVTFGEGTVAVVGAYILAGSAVLGAGQAAYDLYEHGTHGTLTAGQTILDLAQIASAVTGLGALRFGRILAGVRAAAAEGAAVEATSAIKLATRAFVPLRVTGGASDAVTLAVMSADLEKQVDRIRESPLSPGEKKKSLALLFGQFAFTGGLTALSVKGLMPEMVGGSQDIEIVQYWDKQYAIPRGESVQGQAINKAAGELGDASDVGARQAYMQSLGKIGGKGGAALVELETIRLNPDVGGQMSVDATGKLTSKGQAAGDLATLLEKAQLANAAAAAHSVKWQYRVEIAGAGSDGTGSVRIVAEPRGPLAAGEVMRLFTNVSGGYGPNVAAKVVALRRFDPASVIEVRPDGGLRINREIDIGIERLGKLEDEELQTLMKGTRELQAAGGSWGKLKGADKTLAGKLEALQRTKGGRLRFEASKIEGLKWAADELPGADPSATATKDRLPADLGLRLKLLLASADEASLTRFFDLENEQSVASKDLADQADRLCAVYALEQEPKSLIDFVNRYQYARSEFAQRKAAPGKPSEHAIVDDFDNKATRDAIAEAENASRAANVGLVGTVTIKPGSTPADTVRTLKDNADQLRFADEGELTYHVKKHHRELPVDKQAGQPGMNTTEVGAYLDEARETLREPNQWTDRPTQDGLGVVYTFQRQRPGPTKAGKEKFSQLLVYVRFDGQATIVTYIP